MSDILKYTRNIKLIVEIAEEIKTWIGIIELVEMFE